MSKINPDHVADTGNRIVITGFNPQFP